MSARGQEAEARATALATLVAIMEAPRGASANERLRALDLYREMGGGEPDAALALYAWVSSLSDAELDHELRGHLPS